MYLYINKFRVDFYSIQHTFYIYFNEAIRGEKQAQWMPFKLENMKTEENYQI